MTTMPSIFDQPSRGPYGKRKLPPEDSRYEPSGMRYDGRMEHPVQENTISKGMQLMSFQNYVRQLSSGVDENTACKKYKDFMAELSQSKVGRFFDANKDREWFRLRYHPNESQTTLHQQNVNFVKRLKIFEDLNDKNYFHKLPYDASHASAIIDLMDAVIIQLEDGPQEMVDRLLSLDAVKIEPDLKRKFIPIKPCSVIIDDLSIETTLAEIQEICTQANPNLKRIAQLEPYYIAEGLMRRKVIAVYESDTDISDVCWKLSRVKLNNRLLNVSISKPLERRVRRVDALANHYLSIVNDIRNSIILILNFDEQKGLYGKRKQLLDTIKNEVSIKVEVKIEKSSQENNSDSVNNIAPLSPPGSDKSANDDEDDKPFDISSFDEEKEKEKKKLFEFKFNADPSLYRLVNKLNKSKNPVLSGAFRFYVEFTENAEATHQLSRVPKELLDDSSKRDLENSEMDKLTTIEMIAKNLPCTTEESTRYLDRLLWYLRIVHSFDYYNMSIYRLEDDLTLRMGVIHVREDPNVDAMDTDRSVIEEYLKKIDGKFEEFAVTQSQKYVTKDEERYNYKSYGKVLTDELTSYSQRIQKPKSTETDEVYKCRHCTKVFQKLSDIGRHFVSKHRWAIDAIELETDYFNAYLFDATKITPVPPKELLDLPPNRFAAVTNLSQMGEDPDLLQQAIEAYSKMDSFVREPAPRAQTESDPRNESIVDYTDISFDDAI